ncbi:hypothetical protein Pelo_13860 [Pelomyxa schiedti]|nr:hypothetical protein Pelo_13860 [Pelomyxa schiedti]
MGLSVWSDGRVVFKSRAAEFAPTPQDPESVQNGTYPLALNAIGGCKKIVMLQRVYHDIDVLDAGLCGTAPEDECHPKSSSYALSIFLQYNRCKVWESTHAALEGLVDEETRLKPLGLSRPSSAGSLSSVELGSRGAGWEPPAASARHISHCSRLPLTALVLFACALAVLVPTMTVWGITGDTIMHLSSQTAEKSLALASGYTVGSMSSSLSHCEGLLDDLASWINAAVGTLPDGEEYDRLAENVSYAWTLPSRDSKCGKLVALYTSTGFMMIKRYPTYNKIGLQPCYPHTLPSCKKQSYLFDVDTLQTISKMGPPGAPNSIVSEMADMNSTNCWASFISGKPIWTQIGTDPGGKTTVTIGAALMANSSSNSPRLRGVVVFAMSPDFISSEFSNLIGVNGITGVAAVDASGLMIASSLEPVYTDPVYDNATNINKTAPIPVANSTSNVVKRAFADAVSRNMTKGQTMQTKIDGVLVATSRVGASCCGFDAYIITLGDQSYFYRARRTSFIRAAVGLIIALTFGVVAVVATVGSVNFGLSRIKKAVKWLHDYQSDGTTLLSQDDENEGLVSNRDSLKGYKLSVWFSEMDDIADAVDQLAENNHELKKFYPSVFVGMSKADFLAGIHRTGLRYKNVAVLFVDIVKFSVLCTSFESSLPLILHCFLSKLESPIFHKRGLTKRLGDGFMAAFGFATLDDDETDLSVRAHECARLIARNLPGLNALLASRLPGFPGLKLRIGLAVGKASIGVVGTSKMLNADVYGPIVNTAQRYEDSGRYLWPESGYSEPILFSPEKTPLCTITMSEHMHELLDSVGDFSRYSVTMLRRMIRVKNEDTLRTVYVCYEDDFPLSSFHGQIPQKAQNSVPETDIRSTKQHNGHRSKASSSSATAVPTSSSVANDV